MQIKKYRKGFRFYCKHSREFYGPTFRTLEDITCFERWYDGDPSFINTIIDTRTWKQILEIWKSNTHPSPDLEKCIVNLKNLSM